MEIPHPSSEEAWSLLVYPDQFHDVGTALSRRYELPPGGNLRLDLVEPSILPVGVLESMVAFRIACQWFQYWVDSLASGDMRGLSEAESVLLDLQDWPIVVEDGLREFYQPVVEAIRASDTGRIGTHLSANCHDVRQELPAG